jgi:hypothetical protein
MTTSIDKLFRVLTMGAFESIHGDRPNHHCSGVNVYQNSLALMIR